VANCYLATNLFDDRLNDEVGAAVVVTDVGKVEVESVAEEIRAALSLGWHLILFCSSIYS